MCKTGHPAAHICDYISRNAKNQYEAQPRRSPPFVAAVVPQPVAAVVPPLVAAVVRPVAAAVVQPVAKRLARIEALLLEMRFEQDLQAKRVSALKEKLDALTERRFSKREQSGNGNRQVQPTNGTGLAQSR